MVKLPKFILSAGLIVSSLSVAQAQEHLQGPHYQTRNIKAEGEVIAHGAPYRDFHSNPEKVITYPCVMLRVLPNVSWSGGRLWVCGENMNQKMDMKTYWEVEGQPSEMRMTRMGPMMRSVPMLIEPKKNKIK